MNFAINTLTQTNIPSTSIRSDRRPLLCFFNCDFFSSNLNNFAILFFVNVFLTFFLCYLFVLYCTYFIVILFSVLHYYYYLSIIFIFN